MKFKELLTNLLYEQHMPPDPDDDDEIDPEDADNNPVDLNNIDADGNPIDPDHDVPFDDWDFAHYNGEDLPLDDPRRVRSQRPKGPKKLTRTQMIMAKWKEESPGVTDQQLSDAVAFFNERKDRLRPYHPYGYIDPATNRHHINLPEIAVMVERFPNMENILSDTVKMKDLGNYTWEQISFYQDRIYRQAIETDDENWVKGDFTEDQRIQMALQRWTKPYNQIINDGTLTVYKIECKNEAIALGALEHAIFRKYHENEKTLKSLPPDVRRKIKNMEWAIQPWCIARPEGGSYGANLWTNYRPKWGFYFILDNSKPEWSAHHISAIEAVNGGVYQLSTMTNTYETHQSWGDIEQIYPGLRDKEKLFPWFGTTPRETKELTLDTVTFNRGDVYDFAIQPEAVQRAYIENDRFIRDVRCFLTLSFDNRKLYIDKASKTNDDYKQRFICDDPNDPFGILEILRIQKKPDDLYKYLDGFTLKQRLGIPDGIIAIKKIVIGTNWRRWLSDITTNQTLISSRDARNNRNRIPKYGMMDIERGELIKDIQYIASTPRTYMHLYNEDGIQKRKIYIFQRYAYALGNNQTDPNEYFYFLYLKEALIDKNSEYYLKGKYYEGREGDAFIQEKIDSGEFRKI